MNQTHDDVHGGECTALSVTLLWGRPTEVRINVLEQFSGRFDILEKQEDERELV
jgi:hypothetical protein